MALGTHPFCRFTIRNEITMRRMATGRQKVSFSYHIYLTAPRLSHYHRLVATSHLISLENFNLH